MPKALACHDIHYYKMWVQFINPCSLDQWIHYFPTSPHLLRLLNSLKIYSNHLVYRDTFCCNDHTFIKAWIVTRYISLATLKGMPTLEIGMDVLFIQLYNTSSPWTSILLFTNSSSGKEKRNLQLIEEFPLGTLTKRVAWCEPWIIAQQIVKL